MNGLGFGAPRPDLLRREIAKAKEHLVHAVGVASRPLANEVLKRELEVCDRVLFLSRGRILLEGDPRTLPAEHGKDTLEELFITVAREPLSLQQT